MYYKLLVLELKNFIRNPQFGSDLVFKLLTFFGMLCFSLIFFMLSFFMYYYPKDELNINPIQFFSRYFIYYWAFDLVFRYFIQQMPTQNIKPFLTIGIQKKKLVKYTLLKIFFNFFNWGNLLFLIPFTILVSFDKEHSIFNTIVFSLQILLIFYINNFINILLNGKQVFLYLFAGVFASLIGLEYFGFISLKSISEDIFTFIHNYPATLLISIGILITLMYQAYRVIYTNFYLDKGLEAKETVSDSRDYTFLNKYGVLGTFLKNDIRLITRSKAAKSSFFGSLMFLGYGLLYNIESYQSIPMQLFIGIFVSGNFIFLFGQKVPSWDSSYYPLMMTQNVPYIKYLEAKWTLLVVSVIFSMIISSFYLLLSTELYLTILAGGLYNIGVNSYIVLINGAYNKKPIDLNQSSKSFGGTNNFNIKSILLMIPQMIIPMIVYGLTYKYFNIYVAILAIAVLGIIGFLLRNKAFAYIIKLYKKEKYSTLASFKKI